MDEIRQVVRAKLAALDSVSDARRWRVVLSLLARMFANASEGWDRWGGRWRGPVTQALRAMFLLAAGERLSTQDRQDIHGPLAEFDVLDDGSPEWGNLLNVLSICTFCLEGMPLDHLAERACVLFLEGEFHRIANELPDWDGTVSQSIADSEVPKTASWKEVCEFVRVA